MEFRLSGRTVGTESAGWCGKTSRSRASGWITAEWQAIRLGRMRGAAFFTIAMPTASAVRSLRDRHGPATPGTAPSAAPGTSRRPMRCRPGAENAGLRSPGVGLLVPTNDWADTAARPHMRTGLVPVLSLSAGRAPCPAQNLCRTFSMSSTQSSRAWPGEKMSVCCAR